jgi:UDP-N-acetylglucosamine acyltransferase
MALRRAYKTLYKTGLSLADAKQVLAEQSQIVPEVALLLEFLATTTRGIIR